VKWFSDVDLIGNGEAIAAVIDFDGAQISVFIGMEQDFQCFPVRPNGELGLEDHTSTLTRDWRNYRIHQDFRVEAVAAAFAEAGECRGGELGAQPVGCWEVASGTDELNPERSAVSSIGHRASIVRRTLPFPGPRPYHFLVPDSRWVAIE
jgi:hypothetical protein